LGGLKSSDGCVDYVGGKWEDREGKKGGQCQGDKYVQGHLILSAMPKGDVDAVGKKKNNRERKLFDCLFMFHLSF